MLKNTVEKKRVDSTVLSSTPGFTLKSSLFISTPLENSASANTLERRPYKLLLGDEKPAFYQLSSR